MPSSRLPAGHGGQAGYHLSGGLQQNGRSSALPRSGSSSVFSSLETQRTISNAEQPDYRSTLYRPCASTLRSSSLLPAPPGFGLPRANERRIQDDLHFGTEKSNTSLHSSDDDLEEEAEDSGGRHADGNPPGERKKRAIQPMQPIASMGSFSTHGQRTDSNGNGSAFACDLQGKSSEQVLYANSAVVGGGTLPTEQSPRLSAILRALFPNWVPSGQPIAPPLAWVFPGQYPPAPYPHGQGYR